MWWAEWWAWGALAAGLAALEVVLPGYIFLGFAAGAAVTALLLLVGGPAWLVGSLPLLLLLFAVLSAVAWVGMRRVFGLREGQVKIIERDINE
jgi:membrane protein implicated in regulation of membrane protease activity